MTPLLRLFPSVKRKFIGRKTTSFRFLCSESLPWKTSNTGAKKLPGRAHLMLHAVYPLYKRLEDNSTKIYGEETAHRNSTNNTDAMRIRGHVLDMLELADREP